MANTANANNAADETFNREIRKNRGGLVLTSFVELASESSRGLTLPTLYLYVSHLINADGAVPQNPVAVEFGAASTGAASLPITVPKDGRRLTWATCERITPASLSRCATALGDCESDEARDGLFALEL